jgi:diguanylate cyclase (GGDEF)-like protein/PAS domain S-box-containing protein
VFQSKISEPTGHGLAVLEAAVTVTVISLLARGQRDKEHAEEQKRQGEERFRALVQHTSDAILIIEDGGAVRYASPAVEHLFGCPPEQLTALDITWVDADHVEAIHELFQQLRARPGGVDVAEVPIRRVDGSSQWVEVHLTNLIDNPAVGGFVCNMRDIGARRNVHMQLVHEAQHDALTHIANRRLFLDRLDHSWDARTAPTDLIGVLFIDVDHFKEINDQLGHEVGDHVLLTIANELSTLVRPTDLVARFGGDEFTVLLDPLQNHKTAVEIAERIRTKISGPTCIDGHELTLSVSVGVATSRDAACATELLRRSDEAMYSAKRNGRARVESVDTRRLQQVSSLAHFLV